MDIILKSVLGLMTGFFSFYYFRDVFKNRKSFSDRPWSGLLGTGLVTNFLDTLGSEALPSRLPFLSFSDLSTTG